MFVISISCIFKHYTTVFCAFELWVNFCLWFDDLFFYPAITSKVDCTWNIKLLTCFNSMPDNQPGNMLQSSILCCCWFYFLRKAVLLFSASEHSMVLVLVVVCYVPAYHRERVGIDTSVECTGMGVDWTATGYAGESGLRPLFWCAGVDVDWDLYWVSRARDGCGLNLCWVCRGEWVETSFWVCRDRREWRPLLGVQGWVWIKTYVGCAGMGVHWNLYWVCRDGSGLRPLLGLQGWLWIETSLGYVGKSGLWPLLGMQGSVWIDASVGCAGGGGIVFFFLFLSVQCAKLWWN